MDKKKYFIDDRVEVPEEIKRMSSKQRLAEISRLEAAARREKNRIISKRVKTA